MPDRMNGGGPSAAPTDRIPAHPEQDPADAHVLARGDHLARFMVLNRIGTGGMGIVYVAHDPLLNRQVALKVLRPGAVGSLRAREARTRLLREAQAMARLSHPNVIAVHEVGTVEDEIFLVMELNDGGTLRQWLDAARRPWREVVDVFVEAGRGLQAAHRAGLIHRDFKPDNVLLSRDRRVRVVDFGLVHVPVAGERPSHPPTDDGPLAMSLTHTGALLGTPPYMAPEQHRAEPADPRTDQFSFCIALHEGLYGRRPFLGESYAELVGNVLDGVIAPPPPSDVPPAVHQVLLRGLSSERERRYPSMEALLDELCAVADVERGRRASPPRRGRLVLAAAGLVAAIAVVVVAAPWRTEPAAPAIHETRSPTVQTPIDTIDPPVDTMIAGKPDAGAPALISDERVRPQPPRSRRRRRPAAEPVETTPTPTPTPTTETAAERRRRELELSP